MTNRRENRRPRTSPARRKQQGAARPEVDAVAFALTAQIMVCLLIVLVALGARQLSEERFAYIKSEYTALVSGEQGTSLADYFAELAGVAGGFFEMVENIVSGLFGEQPAPQPEFGGPVEAGGMLTPLRFSTRHSRMLPAPQGSTLAPFFLSAQLARPVEGAVTSPFAFRIHPLSGNLNFHNGIDLAAPYGEEVLAALPGVVERVGEDAVYGNYVLLRHAHNLQTFYAHCELILVEEGERVAQGQPVATVGSTGLTTGAHLHFAVIVEGLYADPLFGLAADNPEE